MFRRHVSSSSVGHWRDVHSNTHTVKHYCFTVWVFEWKSHQFILICGLFIYLLLICGLFIHLLVICGLFNDDNQLLRLYSVEL
jgi:hypothetical protein